jgi:hypothetical protein
MRIRGRPLTEWQAGIPLNAMVAILSTMSRITLLAPVAECIGQLKWNFMRNTSKLKDFELFDHSSRGLYGSLVLLSRLPLNLASLGAVITMIAVGFRSFTQQILRYETKDVLSPSTSASFGYAYEYNYFPNISA